MFSGEPIGISYFSAAMTKLSVIVNLMERFILGEGFRGSLVEGKTHKAAQGVINSSIMFSESCSGQEECIRGVPA